MTAPSRELALTLLGDEVGKLTLGEPKLDKVIHHNGHKLDRLIFRASHGQTIPALFMPPRHKPGPAILYCHAHGAAYDIGMRELIDGRPGLSSPWIDDLAAMGIGVLCLEMPCFGQRSGDESSLSKALHWHGKTLFGRMLAELTAGMDWLQANASIDATRIAAFGLSMGGTHAWWLAALDPRFRAALSLCALADLDCLIEQGLHDKHGAYMTVPGLLSHGRTGHWAALAAPTPLFVGLGLKDWSSPPASVERLQADLEPAYSNCPNNLVFHIEPDHGHVETKAMRARAVEFIENALLKT